MANNEQVWVSPNGEAWWRVHKSWASRDIQHFDTKKEAIERATEVAKNQRIELKIQKQNWKIWGWNSYWSDPFPPRDRK